MFARLGKEQVYCVLLLLSSHEFCVHCSAVSTTAESGAIPKSW